MRILKRYVHMHYNSHMSHNCICFMRPIQCGIMILWKRVAHRNIYNESHVTHMRGVYDIWVWHAQQSGKCLCLKHLRFLVARIITHKCYTHMFHTTLTCIIPHSVDIQISQVARVEPIDMAGGQMDFAWDSVGRDSFICVMTHSYLWHMTHSYVWHALFIEGQIWFFWNQVRDACTDVLTHSDHQSPIHRMAVDSHLSNLLWLRNLAATTLAFRDSSIFVTWLTQCHGRVRCLTTLHVRDVTHSYAWHDSFIFVTWRIHMWKKKNATQARIFDAVQMGTLSYLYSM